MHRIETALRAATGGARAFAALGLLMTVSLLSACGGGNIEEPPPTAKPPPAAKGEVNVYNWADYIAEDTLRTFESRTGIRVNYNTFFSLQALEDRMREDPDTYDVIFPSARPTARDMVAGGRLRPLEKNRLQNLGNLDPAILAELAQIDRDNAHLVPYMWGTTGLGIDEKKVRALLGPDAPLDSWSLLFDPTLAEKLSGCGIGVLDDPIEPISAALIHRGMDPSDRSPAAMDTVKRDFTAIRRYVRKFTGSSELIADLASGDLCLALTYSGDVVQAQTKAAETKDGPSLRYVIPREGALRWIDTIAIPKNARNPENAHAFIDFLMDAKVIADITNYVAYANANSASTSLIDPGIAGDPAVYPPADIRATLRATGNLSDEDKARQKTTWLSIVYGEL